MTRACQRVQVALDDALSEGVVLLAPELAAHAALCPRCGPEYARTQDLLARLRGAATSIDLDRVPEVADFLMSGVEPGSTDTGGRRPFRASLGRALGQVFMVAAAILLMAGGLTYTLLKVNEAVSGTRPAEVVDRLVSPFANWTRADSGQNPCRGPLGVFPASGRRKYPRC